MYRPMKLKSDAGLTALSSSAISVPPNLINCQGGSFLCSPFVFTKLLSVLHSGEQVSRLLSASSSYRPGTAEPSEHDPPLLFISAHL